MTCPNGCSDGACKPADPVVEVCEDLTVTPSMTQGGGIVSYTCQSNMDILCILDPNFCKPKTFSVVLKNPAGIVVQTMTTANGIFSIPTTPTGTYTAECFVNGQTTTIAACKKPITITAVTTNPDQEENGNDDHFVSSPIYTALLDNTTGLVYGQDTNLMKLDIAANNKYDILLKTIPINMQIYTKNLNVSNIKLRDKNGNILGVTMTAINKVNEFNKDVQLVITFNDPYAIPAGTGTDFILTGVVMGQSNEYDTVSTWL